MLTNIELSELAEYYHLPLRGVFLRDTLPPGGIKPGWYVYNLDDSYTEGNGLGTHWVCSIGDHDECVFFDSYGGPPPEEVAAFIRTRYRQHGENRWIVQSMVSENCGFFCMAIALWVKRERKKYKSLSDCCNAFVNIFDQTEESDSVLRNFFAKRYANNHPIVIRKLLRGRKKSPQKT